MSKEQLKKKYIAILKFFEKKGLKQKDAVSGGKRVIFCRGDFSYLRREFI